MKAQSFELFVYFIRAYPLRSLTVLVALLSAGLIEMVGVGAFIPLLNVILEGTNNQNENALSQLITNIFSWFNIEKSFSNLLLVIITTICFKSLVVFQAMKLVAFASADITKDLRNNLINSLMHAKWQYYSALPVGQSANAVATEAEYAGHFFMLMGKTISALTQAIIYAIFAFLVDWKVSLAGIIAGSIASFCFRFLVRMARNSGQSMTDSLKSLLTRLNESLSGVKPLKAMGEEGRFTDLLRFDIQQVNLAKKKQYVSNLSLQAFHEPLLIIFMSAGLFWAHHYAHYPITELLLIVFLFHRLINQINLIQGNFQKSVNFESAVYSILQATKIAANNAETMKGTLSPVLKENITFNKITLSYGNTPVVENFSEVIPAHKMTVIFGPSGVGKSTLLDATLGLLSSDKGTILIDNQELKKIDIRKWRHMIGYVPQETFLFHDTIFTNVSLGDKNISEKNVIDALKTSDAWKFINKLDDGIMHVVGERGGKLSGGQRQRIALARALVRKPKLLILDEATAGLDKQSEKIIFTALQKKLPDMTIIAISHDPKMLDIADHVIRLDRIFQGKS